MNSCSNCYWNVNRNCCTVADMLERSGNCSDHRPAKINRRPKRDRAGVE